jgi:hypothetical protein
VNKWFLKTKWYPHIFTLLSLIFAVYVHLKNNKDHSVSEGRLEKLEQYDRMQQRDVSGKW